MNRQRVKQRMTGLLALLLTPGVHAISVPIANSPLFLSTGVQPNIFFMADDSGSMEWETLLSREAFVLHPDAHNFNRQYVRRLDFTPNTDEEIRMLCPGYNVLAYDPAKTYTPWSGDDIRNPGQPYPNSDIRRARKIPNFRGTRYALNDMYILWQDDGDKVYQVGECAVPSFNYGGALDNRECDLLPGCVNVSTLSPAEQQNYANWYTYYRRRDFVAKRALSSVISKTTARIGLATLKGTRLNSYTSRPMRSTEF